MHDRKHEDTKWVIKDWRHNSQKKNNKQYTVILWSNNTNLTNTWGELWCSGKVCSSCATSDTCRVTVKRHEHQMLYKSCFYISICNVKGVLTRCHCTFKTEISINHIVTWLFTKYVFLVWSETEDYFFLLSTCENFHGLTSRVKRHFWSDLHKLE
jgi:hypothetical protein